MKLELQRQDFLKAWNTAEKTASTKTPMDSISSVLIKAEGEGPEGTVTLESTDLKTSVKCSAKGVYIVEAGSAVVPVTVLGSLLRKVKADTVLLDVTPERGSLNAGRSKSRFAVLHVEDFPQIPESSGAEAVCEIMASDLARLISEGSSASSQPQDFPKYLGTCLLRTSTGEGCLKAVSTDGKRLSLSKMKCEVYRDEDLLLPSPALKELGKAMAGNESQVKISADGSTVWFAFGDNEFSIRRIEASFPNYERILNDDVQTTLKIARDDLLSALERVDIIAKTTPAHIMAMHLAPAEELKVTARAPELGTASEMLEADVDGAFMQVGFNVGYFQDGLKALGSGTLFIELSDSEGQARMYRLRAGENGDEKDDDFLYMLMPARLTPQDTMPEDDSEIFAPRQTEEEAPADQTQEQEYTPEDAPF